jgi:hypothetical protein
MNYTCRNYTCKCTCILKNTILNHISFTNSAPAFYKILQIRPFYSQQRVQWIFRLLFHYMYLSFVLPTPKDSPYIMTPTDQRSALAVYNRCVIISGAI